MQEIRERNARVEADKAWETSRTRRTLVGVATYLVAGWIFTIIRTPEPWLDALIPTAAFLVSTLSMPWARQWWLENIYRKG